MFKLKKLTKVFDLKVLAFCLTLLAIITNYYSFEEKCVKHVTDKLPVSINSKKLNRNDKIIVIGGTEFSGGYLMKDILNSHPEIYCQGTKNEFNQILRSSNSWKAGKEEMRLEHAKITNQIIDSSIASFLLETLGESAKMGKTLCIKDYSVFVHANTIARLFPNTKYILMIRDPRTSIYLKFKFQNETDNTQIGKEFEIWRVNMESYYAYCLKAGSKYCLPVFYEKLKSDKSYVEHKKILKFLNIPWNDNLLNYEKNSDEFNAKLSEIENSVDTDTLSRWIRSLAGEVLFKIDKISPFFQQLGYSISI